MPTQLCTSLVAPALSHLRCAPPRLPRRWVSSDLCLCPPQVAANCLSVLVEIEGYGALATSSMLIPLLNRTREFSEWALCVVLDIAARYRPADSAEVYDVMNVLESCLGHANSAVVLATVKVFLHLTLELPEVHQQVSRPKAGYGNSAH